MGHLRQPAVPPSWRPCSWGQHSCGSHSDHHFAANECLTQKARAFSTYPHHSIVVLNIILPESASEKKCTDVTKRRIGLSTQLSFIYQQVLDSYYVPSTVLGFEDPTMSKAQ